MTRTVRPKVDLLVLLTERGPVPYCYADCQRARLHQLSQANRWRMSGLVLDVRIVKLSARRASWWMCHPSYRVPQMVMGHALAKVEGRTTKSFADWYEGSEGVA